ncbi:molybdopterin-guanine dinucleotide biosynthesis protein B [Paenibacillus sp. Z6-24]
MMNTSGTHAHPSLPPVVQIVGYKNSGKTTLVTGLLRLGVARGMRIAVIKHDAHEFQMDHAGTDTFAHTEAGAAAVAITSPARTAIIREQPSTLQQLVMELAAHAAKPYDLILVEGFKQENYPKAVLIARESDVELLDQLSELQWIYTRIEPEQLAGISNFKGTPVIPAGKDGIMELFTALNAYIMSYPSN